MKRLIISCFVAASALLTVGGTADAYPVDSCIVSLDPTSPTAGAQVKVSITNGEPNGIVSLEWQPDVDNAGVVKVQLTAAGTGQTVLTAPSVPGSYGLKVTCSSTTSFVVPVVVQSPPQSSLPATGSSSGGTVTYAAALLLLGAGLFAVGRVRRRRPVTA